MANRSPLILVHRYGKQYLRGRPAKVRQTAASRKTAAAFGTASSLASQLVHSFAPLIGTSKDQDIYRRFFAALSNWMRTYSTNPAEISARRHFEGFRFVKSAGLENRFRVRYSAEFDEEGRLVVRFDPFVATEKIIAPPGCGSVTLKLLLAGCRPDTGELLPISKQEISWKYDNKQLPETEVILAGNNAAGVLNLLAMSLSYDCITERPVARYSDRAWMPGGVVASWFEPA